MKKFFIFLMAIMMCVISIVPCYAAELPYSGMLNLPVEFADVDYYWILKPNHNNSYFLQGVIDKNDYESSVGAEFKVYTTGSLLFLDNDNNRKSFTFVQAEYFPENSSYGEPTVLDGKTSWNLGNLTQYEIYYSTIDITYEDGTVFFPKAPAPMMELYQKIQKVTDQEMTTLPAQVGGAMKILALCGVGCLALLMVLPLFGKVLNRYR